MPTLPPLYADVLFREQKNSILYSECTLKNPHRCHRHYRHRSATGERAADEKTCRQPLAYRIARRADEPHIFTKSQKFWRTRCRRKNVSSAACVPHRPPFRKKETRKRLRLRHIRRQTLRLPYGHCRLSMCLVKSLNPRWG